MSKKSNYKRVVDTQRSEVAAEATSTENDAVETTPLEASIPETHAEPDTVQMPRISQEVVKYQYRSKDGEYMLGDLLDMVKYFHEHFNIMASIKLEERQIHCYSKRARAQRSTTMVQPLNIIRRFLTECANTKIAAVYNDEESTYAFIENPQGFDYEGYAKYITDVDAPQFGDGKSIEVS